ncbi:glycosyltransferase [Rhodopirellula sp. SWK7]|nr:glycosyltransferase [Rhodopirellula sp. SWK7]
MRVEAEVSSPKLIAVDARCLNRVHVRGIGKVLTSIIEHSSDKVQWLLFGDRPDLPFHAPKVPHLEVVLFDQKGYRLNAWEQWALPLRVSRSGADLLLCPANSAPLWQPCPTVAILHDTIAWQNEKGILKSAFFKQHILPHAFKRAAAIVTISKSSKDDILERWPELSPKLTTIPNGVDDIHLQQFSDEMQHAPAIETTIRQPYVLYFGGGIARKRFEWALQVFLQTKSSGLRLVACGIDETAALKFAEQIPATHRERVVFPGYVTETKLRDLYQHASGALYPTLYEGFGLPIIEAHAAGIPIVHGCGGSLAELAGPLSVVLDDFARELWIDAVEAMIRAKPTDIMASKAREYASEFCWSNAAEHYMRVFAAAIQPERTLVAAG